VADRARQRLTLAQASVDTSAGEQSLRDLEVNRDK
jgi:hypothetical protein